MSQSSSSQPVLRQNNDEISLVDLCLALIQRKKLIAFVTALCIVIGVVLYYPASTKTYVFTTLIEIGSSGNNVLFDTIENIKTRLNNTVIPALLKQYRDEPNKQKYGFAVNAEFPQNGRMVVLSSKGVLGAEKDIFELHERMIDELEATHMQRYMFEKNKVDNQIEILKIELKSLKAPGTLEMAKLDIHKALAEVRRQLFELNDPATNRLDDKQLRSQISSAEERYQALLEKSKSSKDRLKNLLEDESVLRHSVAVLRDKVDGLKETLTPAQLDQTNDGVALLLMDKQEQRLIARLEGIEKRLFIDIPQEKSGILSEIADYKTEQVEQLDLIDILNLNLDRVAAMRERDVAELRAEEDALKTQLAERERRHLKEIEIKQNEIKALENTYNMITATGSRGTASSESVSGRSPLLIIAVAVALGLVLSVFVVLLVDFIGLLRAKQAAMSEN